jgi:hypothetical protein
MHAGQFAQPGHVSIQYRMTNQSSYVHLWLEGVLHSTRRLRFRRRLKGGRSVVEQKLQILANLGALYRYNGSFAVGWSTERGKC